MPKGKPQRLFPELYGKSKKKGQAAIVKSTAVPTVAPTPTVKKIKRNFLSPKKSFELTTWLKEQNLEQSSTSLLELAKEHFPFTITEHNIAGIRRGLSQTLSTNRPLLERVSLLEKLVDSLYSQLGVSKPK